MIIKKSKITQCSQCGHSVSKKAQKCPECGETNFQTAICYFCKKRDAKNKMCSHNVKAIGRPDLFAPKIAWGTTHGARRKTMFYHKLCKEKYLGPIRKKVSLNCSDCGKTLILNSEKVFRQEKKEACPNCGAPNQPLLPKAREYGDRCDICNTKLYPKFQRISRHSYLDEKYVYHTVCAFKTGFGIFDLGWSRNLIVIGILIIIIFSIF